MSADTAAVDHKGAEAFGGAVDRSREPGRPAADDDEVEVAALRVHGAARSDREFCVARIGEDFPVGEYDQRKRLPATGIGDLALANGGSYHKVFLGIDSKIPPRFRLPENVRIDVLRASDQQILDTASTLVAVYLNGLIFSFDANGVPNGSPYDRFLLKNSLPQQRKSNETAIAYARRLRRATCS